MKVGIIGAGIAGIAAGRILHASGHTVTIFEKSKGYGGRLATRRIESYTFDSGASNVTPRQSRLTEAMLREIPTDDLVQIVRPIWFHENFHVTRGSAVANKDARYTYRNGITQLTKLLANNLEIRLEQHVDRIEVVGDKYEILGENFDAIVVSAPLPQTELLLHSAGQNRLFEGVRYRSCLSVLLGYDVPTPDVAYFALLDVEQVTPLTWLSIENLKSPDRAPEGHTALVAQMSASYSQMHSQTTDAQIIRDALVYVKRLISPDLAVPVVAQLKRWKYSQPELTTSFARANPRGTRLVVAGDALAGGRVEMAYDSGCQAAEHLNSL